MMIITCCSRLHLIGFLVLLLGLPSIAIQWIGLVNGSQRAWNASSHCARSKREGGLISAQVRICKQHLELMRVVWHSAKETMTVCQELFKDRRWNCSSILKAPQYTPDLNGGSREQAYVYALSSAALVQAVGKACSLGLSSKCGCGLLPSTPPAENFRWEGCGDNVPYGIRFSTLFADAPFVKGKHPNRRERSSKKAMVNLHNNKAGRKIVKDSLTTACKCHGVSGSCSIKTCWKSLPSILSIGTSIQKSYAVAVEIKQRKKRGRKRLVSVNKVKRTFEEHDLVYYTKSPDYCEPDKSAGSVGTRGRQCKKDDRGSGGCGSMCCGRGYTSNTIEVKQRCECKYYWCCYVKCKTCIKTVEINRCV